MSAETSVAVAKASRVAIPEDKTLRGRSANPDSSANSKMS